jgi:hypothetical protein
MAGLDENRIAMVVARPAGDDASTRSGEELATGYFLTGDLVLTAGHIGATGSTFSVRSEIGVEEKDHWSDAVPEWTGAGDVDAMLLRTSKRFGDWKPPSVSPQPKRGKWRSAGYAKAAVDSEGKNRQTQPLEGSFASSGGPGAAALALTTEQTIAAKWDDHWKGISGAPVFSITGDKRLVGIITHANRAFSNGLIGLPTARLLDDLQFHSIVFPDSFLRPPLSRPWCLVLTAENSRSDLVEQVAGVLIGFRAEDERFAELDEGPIELRVVDAIESVENWAVSVDALARADYMVADVTTFEPAVMLLLGIRSVLRRGVTVSVTAGDLSTDDRSEPKSDGTSDVPGLPFNVQETRVLSYDDEHFYDDLHRAMTEGAANLARDANYLDLPAFHAVRAPRPETWAVDNAQHVLVLCPFAKSYSDFYRKKLRPVIMAGTQNMTPLRMLDLRSPRLVGQALYEQIRWASHCLVDWSGWRANVMFELGVRLASSDHDPLSIIDEADLDGHPADGQQSRPQLEQHHLLRELFTPVAYDQAAPFALVAPLKTWWGEQRSAGPGASRGAIPPGGTFGIAQASFLWRQDPMLTRPHVELRERAERILGKDQEKQPERLILFADNEPFDLELRASVREKWIAAWLYLRHLASADDDDRGNVRTEFIAMSHLVVQALKASSDRRHIALREEISDLLGPAVAEDRTDEVRALKASAKSARADEDWQLAIGELHRAVELLVGRLPDATGRTRAELASELADSFGMIGGIERRWGLSLAGAERQHHLEASVEAYDSGFSHEQDLDPNVASTYNRINRLVGRVLLNPHVLDADDDTTPDVMQELGAAQEILVEQLRSVRVGDPWGYCDLGLIRVLHGSTDPLPTYHELARLRPPKFVYESALATLEPLSEVASELRPALRSAVEFLQTTARQAAE